MGHPLGQRWKSATRSSAVNPPSDRHTLFCLCAVVDPPPTFPPFWKVGTWRVITPAGGMAAFIDKINIAPSSLLGLPRTAAPLTSLGPVVVGPIGFPDAWEKGKREGGRARVAGPFGLVRFHHNWCFGGCWWSLVKGSKHHVSTYHVCSVHELDTTQACRSSHCPEKSLVSRCQEDLRRTPYACQQVV